jgi:diguanylate cyclase (GGDEF)-like protein
MSRLKHATEGRPAATYLTSEPKARGGNVIAFVLVTLFLAMLTIVDAMNGAQAWRTEISMLAFSAMIVGAWYGPLRLMLSVSLLVSLVLCGVDLRREPTGWTGLVGHAGRAIMIVVLVTGASKARRMLERACHLARVDGLTGLPNRQAILEALAAELCRIERFGRSFSIAMLDCDDFKLVNDRSGHAMGDNVLRLIANALRKQMRSYDCVGRLGGDEFVFILSEVHRDEVEKIIERLRKCLRQELEHTHPGLTFSIGVVTLHVPAMRRDSVIDSSECLEQVDIAMYAAKRAGRDQTRFETFKAGFEDRNHFASS